MSQPLVEEIAEGTGADTAVVIAVLQEFCLQLHKRLYEYEGVNSDYLGEEFRRDISDQAFFHFLGFLDTFADRYGWEPGTAREYLSRLGTRAQWLPFFHQMNGWERAGHEA